MREVGRDGAEGGDGGVEAGGGNVQWAGDERVVPGLEVSEGAGELVPWVGVD